MGSSPNWPYGYVPTAAQWNDWFGRKQDELGYTPVNRAGDSMAGRLIAFGSTSAAAGFNVAPGVAPNDPADGDVWYTTLGMFYRKGGSTIGPLGPGSVTSVGLTMPTQLDVANSPVTGSGTLDVTWKNQTQKTFLAGPASGSDAAPTFRTLQTTDLPGTLVQTSAVNTFTASQVWAKGANVASAATLTLGTDGNYFHITGSTGPITSIVSTASPFTLCFDSTPTINNNANIILPGGAAITVGAGDVLVFENEGAGVVRCTSYQRAAYGPFAMRAPDVIVQDQKTTGTNGGSASATTTQTRTLNTKVRDPYSYCSLATNQITLLSGTWYLEASAPASAVDRHRASLYNVTDSAIVLLGQNSYAGNAGVGETLSVVSGVFTVATGKALELRHYTQAAQANIGLGVAVSDGNTEIYSAIKLWKVA